MHNSIGFKNQIKRGVKLSGITMPTKELSPTGRQLEPLV